jgi:uncharacterized membrane protein
VVGECRWLQERREGVAVLEAWGIDAGDLFHLPLAVW